MKADYIHKEYPKQFARDQFWRQIKRTVNGQPVSESDIKMIVDQILARLNLVESDQLLDLGCGNGALASRLFPFVGSYLGIDFSAYLLEIAKEYFCPSLQTRYEAHDIRDVASYARFQPETNKILIYGCLSYLSYQETRRLLGELKALLPCLETIFLGNIPNLEQAGDFFSQRQTVDFETDDPQSPIGVWWDIDQFHQMASELGYRSQHHVMPAGFYGRKYRFDMVLETKSPRLVAGN